MSNFKNSSIYFIPIKVNDKNKLNQFLERDIAWEKENNPVADYLFPYASAVMTDDTFCITYNYALYKDLKLYMFDDRIELNEKPRISSIRLDVFSTNVAFLEICLEYGSNNIEQIIEFANRFKSATKSKNYCKEGDISLPEMIEIILPEETMVEAFFTNTKTGTYQFRKNCLCFHAIYLPDETNHQEIAEQLFLLTRNYRRDFSEGWESAESRYDYYYTPYSYMHWGLSQEGMVCICNATQNERSTHYIENFHYIQLMKDYKYLYLILLNQRFSAISYMGQIAKEAAFQNQDALTTEIIKLKTHFSFKVISDDRIYQNIYTKMFEIFEIADFIEDLSEMSEKTASIQMKRTEERAKKTENFLASISVLAIFSALIDAASYFERISLLHDIATILSFSMTAMIIVWLLFANKRKR